MNNLNPNDVPKDIAIKILNFLNSAKSAKEIADRIKIPGIHDIGLKVAQNILDTRKKNGKFINLDQLNEVDHIGPTRFNHIMNSFKNFENNPTSKKTKKKRSKLKKPSSIVSDTSC